MAGKSVHCTVNTRYLPASSPVSVSAILGRDLRVRLILKHKITSYGSNTIIVSSLLCFIQTRIRISPSSISIHFSYCIRLPPYPAVIVFDQNINIKTNCHILFTCPRTACHPVLRSSSSSWISALF